MIATRSQGRPARAAPGTLRRVPPALLVPAAVAALLALAPIGYLVVRAGEGGLETVLRVLSRPRTLELAVRSLGLAAVVTALCVLVGVSLAWLVVRTDLPGRRLFGVLAALPLAVPSYVAAYTWVAALPQVAGFGGAVLVLTLCCYPYVYLPVAAALGRMDPAMEEVALSLGRSRFSVVWRRLRPAAAAGGLLVALYVLGEFGAVAVVSGKISGVTETLPLYVSKQYETFNVSGAYAAAVLLALLGLATLFAMNLIERGGRKRDQAITNTGHTPGTGLSRGEETR